MEDKKTLWILFGIGVCVLVVAAVGFFWFLPEDPAVASSGENNVLQAGKPGFDPVEWVRKEEAYPGLDQKDGAAAEGDEFVVVTDELVYGQPGDKPSDPAADGSAATAADTAGNGPQAAETASADQSGSPDARPQQAADAKPAEETVIRLSTSDNASSQGIRVTTINPAEIQRTRPSGTAAAKAPSSSAARKPATLTEYWIQAGSFSTVQKANDVRAHLSELGAASTLSTTTVNGTNYYRVRLGPYGQKLEAAKFLDWIKAVDGFESSYISEVYVKK